MPKRNLAWIVIVAMIALLMWQLPQTIAGRDSVLKAFGPLVDARSLIRRRFVEVINDDDLVEAAVDAGIRAMIQSLDDPHAIYLNAAEYKRFRQRTDGRYGGIGVEVWAVEEGLEVLSREPASPAMQAEILPGDIITHIDGVSTKGLPLFVAVNNLLKGPQGSALTITVITPGRRPRPAAREMKLYRAIIKLDPVQGWSRVPGGGWRFMLDPEEGIAYVRLVKFTPDVDERLDEEINRLRRHRLRGLILDLRENSGGLLNSAREVVDKFLESGLIVRTSGRRSDEKNWHAVREGTYPRVQMVVLVNGSTASAAEIVAGALRDHERAVVIGEQTYGKGSVQEVIELARHRGAIKLTTGYYYLPSGRRIHRRSSARGSGAWGVAPDIEVTLDDDQRARWLEAWREIGREPAEQAGETEADNGSMSANASADHDAAEALLEADPQLKAALGHLQDQLGPSQGPEPTSTEDANDKSLT